MWENDRAGRKMPALSVPMDSRRKTKGKPKEDQKKTKKRQKKTKGKCRMEYGIFGLPVAADCAIMILLNNMGLIYVMGNVINHLYGRMEPCG